jgi:dCTP deaminase
VQFQVCPFSFSILVIYLPFMVISFETSQIRRCHVLKNDRWIREMAEKGMITPFNREQVGRGIISYGVSSYGYDMRIADEFKIFRAETNILIDPKNFSMESFIDFKGDVCTVPPNSFVLGRSVEYFRIPREVLVICLGKSTYARCGIVINVTPLEPEWEGYVTIEISNTAPLPAKVYANEGIAQILFIEGSEICEKSYADKAGKYQAQKGITPAKI